MVATQVCNQEKEDWVCTIGLEGFKAFNGCL